MKNQNMTSYVFSVTPKTVKCFYEQTKILNNPAVQVEPCKNSQIETYESESAMPQFNANTVFLSDNAEAFKEASEKSNWKIV